MAIRMSVAVDTWTFCGERARPVAEADTGRPFAALYRDHARFVWRILRRFGVPDSEVDDAAHEVFIVAYRKRDSLYAAKYERSWLYGIAKRVAMHTRRKMQRDPEPLSPTASPDDDPEEAVARQEAAALARRAIEGLDERRRMVFVLAEIEEMTAPEIAATLEIPVNTVYSRLRIARREFDESMARARAKDGRVHGRA